ncbi:MAG: hypothetical protein M0Z83_06235 [Betaproteobacteria bacterium]|nr:hypothetical protein [Betaproteobacteria bacterium]
MSIDAYNLAESHLTASDFRLHVEGIGENKYKITDWLTGQSATISNLNDATSFLLEITDTNVDYFAEIQLDLNSDELGLDASSYDRLLEEYGSGMKDLVFLKAEEAWVKRDEYDPEK